MFLRAEALSISQYISNAPIVKNARIGDDIFLSVWQTAILDNLHISECDYTTFTVLVKKGNNIIVNLSAKVQKYLSTQRKGPDRYQTGRVSPICVRDPVSVPRGVVFSADVLTRRRSPLLRACRGQRLL